MIYTTDEIKSGKFYTDDEEWITIDDVKEIIKNLKILHKAKMLSCMDFDEIEVKLSSKQDKE